MRIVFIGAGGVVRMTTKYLLKDGHDVVIIEWNKEKIEEVSEDLDCGFIHGDGTKPAILNEADPQKTDILFCNSDIDHNNIISNLLAKSLGFKRIVTIIRDSDLERLCRELHLENTLLPRRMTSHYLHELVYGRDIIQQYKVLKNGASLFSFIAEEETSVNEVKLPKQCKVVWLYRKNDFIPADPETKIHAKDEVVILTHPNSLEQLQKQFEKTQ